MAGWGDFLGGLMNKMPIQDRWERIRNRIEKLEKEKKKLMKGKWNEKKSRRLSVINNDINRDYRLLKNKS